MIDPLQITVLVKAMDFLFDEGHKILQERRERRQEDSSLNAPTSSNQDQPPLVIKEVLDQPEPTTKQKFLEKKIDLDTWNANEEHVQHLMKLIEINLKKYYLAKEQYSKWGAALVPSIIVMNLEEAENGLRENAIKLKQVLDDVYGEKIDLNLPIN